MFEAIIAKVGGAFIDRIFGGLMEIGKAWINKEITDAQAREKILSLMVNGSRDVEVAHSHDLADTYRTFWGAADNDKSNLMKRMWAFALGSQIFVLFWSQWVVPLLFAFGMLPNWKAGTSAEWAYLLVGGLLGMGPMVLRSGPASGDYIDKLKNLAIGVKK